jgi:hypothetical protein
MATETSSPVGIGSTDQLGPLPHWAMREAYQGAETRYYTADQMRTYAAQQVAAERERWTSSAHHCTIKCAQCGHKNYFTRAELEREA